VCGLEVDAIAGYPKKGFRDDKGGRAIVDGVPWVVESGGAALEGALSTPRIWDWTGDWMGTERGGGGGGRWWV